MRTMTATEAIRSFAALLDEAERGETIVVTRGGRRIATIGPAAAANGAGLIASLDTDGVDADFGRDVRTARIVLTTDDHARFGDLPGVDSITVG